MPVLSLQAVPGLMRPGTGALTARSLLQRTGSSAAIFSPPIFLPSIFLPFLFSFLCGPDSRVATTEAFFGEGERTTYSERRTKNDCQRSTSNVQPACWATGWVSVRVAKTVDGRVISNAPADPRLTFHRLIFLPSIFLPFPLSPLFVFFGYHRNSLCARLAWRGLSALIYLAGRTLPEALPQAGIDRAFGPYCHCSVTRAPTARPIPPWDNAPRKGRPPRHLRRYKD